MPDQQIELEAHGSWVVGRADEEVEDRVGMGTRLVAPAVGDDALGCGEHRLEHEAVGRPVALDAERSTEQVHDLQRTFDTAAGVEEAPRRVRAPWTRRRTRRGEERLQRTTGANCMASSWAPDDGAARELALQRTDDEERVDRQLVAHRFGHVEEPLHRLATVPLR